MDDASPPEAEASALPLLSRPLPSSSALEIRLFYVRVSPSSASAAAPPCLTLSHLPRTAASPLEVDGLRLPAGLPHSLALRRQHPALTYLSTDPVRLAGPADFEVLLDGIALLRGSFRPSWSLHCRATAAAPACLGPHARELEVYVAACCAGSPLVLTHTVLLSTPRRRPGASLHAIPEHEDDTAAADCEDTDGAVCPSGSDSHLAAEEDTDDYEAKLNMASSLYPDGAFYDEDGQLSWFNAGVRVGVGIGLGMCIGVGLGVGLLMRSYQATRNNFRRRFF